MLGGDGEGEREEEDTATVCCGLAGIGDESQDVSLFRLRLALEPRVSDMLP